MSENEIEFIRKVYEQRSYDSDPRYSDANPEYLQRVQDIEWHIHEALRATRAHVDISDLDILDFGCGNGRWTGRWLAWGADPNKLRGVDVREPALAMARRSFPGPKFLHSEDGTLDLPDQSVDVVFVNLVFSSILSQGLRGSSAAEIKRVLKIGGLVLWYDLIINNPRNSNVRCVTEQEVTGLMRPLTVRYRKRLTLAPPLARRVVPRSRRFAEVMSIIPLLKTHIFLAFENTHKNLIADNESAHRSICTIS